MDAQGRQYRRARAALLAVEVFHYLLAVLGFLVGAVVLLPGLIEALGQVGRTGSVAWREVDRALTGLVIVSYACFSWWSAVSMARLTRRHFSLYFSVAHLATIVGIPVGVLTWAVLTRRSVTDLYELRPVPYRPLVIPPPPLPLPVVPLTDPPRDDSHVAAGSYNR